MSVILPLATSIIFNSFYQYATYKDRILDKNKQLENLGLSPIKMGLRINPLYSEVTPAIYNPCSKMSRLGITPSGFEKGVKEHGLRGGERVAFPYALRAKRRRFVPDFRACGKAFQALFRKHGVGEFWWGASYH